MKSLVAIGVWLGLVVAAIAHAPADAATALVTYRGKVFDGEDRTGVFGAARTFLSEVPFAAVFAVRTDVEGATHVNWSPHFSYTTGFAPNNPVAGVLHIGNGSASFGSLFADSTSVSPGNFGSYGSLGFAGAYMPGYVGTSGLSTATQDWKNIVGEYVSRVLNLNLFSSENVIAVSRDYTAPLSYTVQPGDSNFGYFSFHEGVSEGGPLTQYAYGNLRIESVNVTLVPEPTTWAMMIVGFAAAGSMVRRRRAVAA